MKWKSAVGLALALAGWSRFAEDMPTHDLFQKEEPPFKPECKNGERLAWDPSARRWVCIPRL
tara:strand:- start:187 stop:372 length:186 start_codon:yes stop_codon:yes gene_type:complete